MTGDCLHSEKQPGATGRGSIRLRMFGLMWNINSAANHGSKPRHSLTICSDSVLASLTTRRAERSSDGSPTGGQSMAPIRRCSSRKITTPDDSLRAISRFAIHWA